MFSMHFFYFSKFLHWDAVSRWWVRLFCRSDQNAGPFCLCVSWIVPLSVSVWSMPWRPSLSNFTSQRTRSSTSSGTSSTQQDLSMWCSSWSCSTLSPWLFRSVTFQFWVLLDWTKPEWFLLCPTALRTVQNLQWHHGHPQHGLHWTLHGGDAAEAACSQTPGQKAGPIWKMLPVLKHRHSPSFLLLFSTTLWMPGTLSMLSLWSAVWWTSWSPSSAWVSDSVSVSETRTGPGSKLVIRIQNLQC